MSSRAESAVAALIGHDAADTGIDVFDHCAPFTAVPRKAVQKQDLRLA